MQIVPCQASKTKGEVVKHSEAVALLMKLFQELPLKVRREIADLLTRPNPLTAKCPKKRGGK